MPEKLPACFGGMFPNLDTVDYNKDCSGAVFTVHVTSSGLGPQNREISMNREKLETCMACPQYRFCYDLSMAKLAFNSAVNHRF